MITLAMLPRGIYAQASNHYGAAYLAFLSPRFPCDSALKIYKGLPEANLAILWGTFGDSLKCLKKYAAIEKPKILIVHFSNESCRRLNRCYEGEFLPGLNSRQYERALIKNRPSIQKKIAKRASAIKRSLGNLGIDLVLLSTGLESDFNKTAAENLALDLHATTGYEIINNPNHSCGGARLCESHDPRTNCGKQSDIFVNDGFDIVLSKGRRVSRNEISLPDLRTTFRRNARNNCFLQLIWWGETQGRRPNETRFIKPRSRDLRISPKSVSVLNKFLASNY